jgi:hypothetical protein
VVSVFGRTGVVVVAGLASILAMTLPALAKRVGEAATEGCDEVNPASLFGSPTITNGAQKLG